MTNDELIENASSVGEILQTCICEDPEPPPFQEILEPPLALFTGKMSKVDKRLRAYWRIITNNMNTSPPGRQAKSRSRPGRQAKPRSRPGRQAKSKPLSGP